jgi:hypothetical protein
MYRQHADLKIGLRMYSAGPHKSVNPVLRIRVRSAHFFSRGTLRNSSQKKKKKKCGFLREWPFGVNYCEILRVRESAGAPPKIKTGLDTFFRFRTRARDVTSCYNTVLGDFFKVQSTLSSRFHYNRQRNDSSDGRYSNPPPEVIRIHRICARAQGSGKGSGARCGVDNH